MRDRIKERVEEILDERSGASAGPEAPEEPTPDHPRSLHPADPRTDRKGSRRPSPKSPR